jgi:hypothetical protein
MIKTMALRGKEGRWFDVGVYLLATISLLATARVFSFGPIALAALIPSGSSGASQRRLSSRQDDQPETSARPTCGDRPPTI